MAKTIIIILTLLFIVSCYIDVPHDAKFDPLNPFAIGEISVSVSTLDNNPIENAIIIFNERDTVFTDENGKIPSIEIIHDTINIKVIKNYYEEIQIDTVLQAGEKLNLSVNMNYIVQIIDKNVYSIVKRKNELVDTLDYFIIYNILLKDYDGEENIDSIIINFPENKLYMQLDSTVDSLLYYSYTIDENNSPINIFDIEGMNVNIDIFENKINSYNSGNLILIRFVQNIAKIINPANGYEFDMPDTLKWENETETYQSFINIKIKQNDNLIFEIDSMNISESEYYIDTIFASGEYDLYIKIFDSFDNYSINSSYFLVP